MDEMLLKKICDFEKENSEFLQMIQEEGLPNFPKSTDANLIRSNLNEITEIIKKKKGEEGVKYFRSLLKNPNPIDETIVIYKPINYYKQALIVLNIDEF
jgi:hypothetical protein